VERNVYRILMGKPGGKRPFGRPRSGSEDGIRMDLRENGWGSVDWIQLAQDRDLWRALVNTVMNLLVLAPRSEFIYIYIYIYKIIKFLNKQNKILYSNILSLSVSFVTKVKHETIFKNIFKDRYINIMPKM
jgi:hypothetical protein